MLGDAAEHEFPEAAMGKCAHHDEVRIHRCRSVNQLILRRSFRRDCMGFCIDACPAEPGDDPGQRRFRIETLHQR